MGFLDIRGPIFGLLITRVPYFLKLASGGWRKGSTSAIDVIMRLRHECAEHRDVLLGVGAGAVLFGETRIWEVPGGKCSGSDVNLNSMFPERSAAALLSPQSYRSTGRGSCARESLTLRPFEAESLAKS